MKERSDISIDKVLQKVRKTYDILSQNTKNQCSIEKANLLKKGDAKPGA